MARVTSSSNCARQAGIDPACDPERFAGRGTGRVRFIAEPYSGSHSDLPCDLLCCRHTLEHIHPTNELVGNIRRVVGGRNDTIVFFEVPDVGRVLREQAYWDIYYEHCSYFSLGSLARLFRANRFDVVELAKDYDDQYLLIVVRPSEDPTSACMDEEGDLAQVASEVEIFTSKVHDRIAYWRSRVATLRDAHRRIAIWGSGSKCVAFLSTIDIADEVVPVVDINPHRHGKFLPVSGRQVVAPESLRTYSPDTILVMNPIYRKEIQRQIDGLGVCAELIPV